MLKIVQALAREAGAIGVTEKSLSTKHSFDRRSSGIRLNKKTIDTQKGKQNASTKMGATSTNAFPLIISRKKNRKTPGQHRRLSNDGAIPKEGESVGSVAQSEE